MPRQKQQSRIYLRGRIYWGRYYDAQGEEHRRSTLCRDKDAALQLVRQWERDATDPRRSTAPLSTTIGNALTLLVNERETQARQGKRSADTALFYRKKAGHWLRLLGADFDLGALTSVVVDHYIDVRREEGAGESTISKELITLRASLKIAQRKGLFHGVIPAILPSGFSPEYKPRSSFLTPSEVELLLPQLARDRAARVAFAIATSANLRETDLAQRGDLGDEAVLLRGTKRHSRTREVPIVFEWQRVLLVFAKAHGLGEKGVLFTPWGNMHRDLNAALERAHISRASKGETISTLTLSSNDLRRTTATWLRSEGVPPDLIAAILGHKDSRMVERVYGRMPQDLLASRIRASVNLISEDDCTIVVRKREDAMSQMSSMSSTAQVGHKREKPSRGAIQEGFSGLPRDGVEPPTRGFSVSISKLAKRFAMPLGATNRTATVQQLCGNTAPLVSTAARPVKATGK